MSRNRSDLKHINGPQVGERKGQGVDMAMRHVSKIRYVAPIGLPQGLHEVIINLWGRQLTSPLGGHGRRIWATENDPCDEVAVAVEGKIEVEVETNVVDKSLARHGNSTSQPTGSVRLRSLWPTQWRSQRVLVCTVEVGPTCPAPGQP
ncbi:hypothetical protein NBO_248g0001 [Nosema bombycis CQ1]|uniref:Uncharacterized protein n=1 Tax=Nosema bombycis (strain CQ1 / CVCC 102059) TaxID=578461 RepID=R0M4V3_NOSB1|nr:hypothetical protein NBO_248g0001 [Nosema bombycis CQ1]|eukprot:EOB13024.1 hypothetical protein NBO_248g0001 [Nosema bombycis CQ1]